MITLEQVEQARNNPELITDIYNQVFNDNKKPKLRMWLVKKGVDYKELDDVESTMKLSFMKVIHKYNHDKISFEKYVWTEFNQVLLNYFQSKKVKKYTTIGFDDMNCMDEDGSEYVSKEISMDLGHIPEPDYKYDFENIFSKLTQIQGTICRMIYYSEWNKDDVIEYLGISRDKYNREMKHIRTVFNSYLTTGMVCHG